jgi:hypothetical protein
MARPLAIGVVYTGVDLRRGLHTVARAACEPCVGLPLSSVEPVYELNPHVLVAESNHYPDRGRPAPQHQLGRRTLQPEHISLPVRLPGQHLHPQLRRSPWDGVSDRAGSSA